MIIIDRYSYDNRLRTVHPGEKFLFTVLAFVLCFAARSPVVPVVVLLVMFGLLVFGAGIPWQVLGRLMTVPASFILLGGATVVFSVTLNKSPSAMAWYVDLGGLVVGVTPSGFSAAVGLFSRSLGALGCLYFLSLTTPMVEIVWVLRRLRFPALILELVTLIYRFIFVLLAAAEAVHRAQDARLGYSSLRIAYRSLASLVSMLFGKAYHYAQILYLAMLARGYDGEIRVLDLRWSVSLRNILAIALIITAIFLLALLTGGVGLVGVHSGG